ASQRDGRHDLGPALREVAVQHGLAVLDRVREAPRRDGLPSLLLGEGSGCGDDPLPTLLELPRSARCRWGRHGRDSSSARRSLIEFLALIDLRSSNRRMCPMEWLQVVAVVVCGLMVGVELSVAFVINPIVD